MKTDPLVGSSQSSWTPICTVTTFSKYFALILFVAVPGLAFWLGTQYPVTEYEVGPVDPPLQLEQSTSTPVVNEVVASSTASTSWNYVNREMGFSINFPSTEIINPIPAKIMAVMGRKEKVSFPLDWLEIPGMFYVSKVPYENLKEENGLLTYTSCCTGTKYFYSTEKKLWSAEDFILENDTLVEKPVSLVITNQCVLERNFGANKFYRFEISDEGVAPRYHYLLMTDQGYAIRFDTEQDLEDEDATEIELRIKDVLASVSLSEGIFQERSGCK